MFRDGGDVWGTWCWITCRHTCFYVCSALPHGFFSTVFSCVDISFQVFESAIGETPSQEVRVFNCGKYWPVLCGGSWSVVLGKQQPVSRRGFLPPNQRVQLSHPKQICCSVASVTGRRWLYLTSCSPISQFKNQTLYIMSFLMLSVFFLWICFMDLFHFS